MPVICFWNQWQDFEIDKFTLAENENENKTENDPEKFILTFLNMNYLMLKRSSLR